MKKHRITNYVLSALSIAFVSQTVNANEPLNRGKEAANDFVYVVQNPLSPVYSVPLKYTYHGGADNGGVSIGSIQPIIPVQFEDWSLINQLSLNFIGTPGVVNGIAELPEPYPGDGVAGLGDTTLTSYISPAGTGKFSWGVGPTFVFPTDTLFSDTEDRRSRQLGSGKFSVGPALMFVTQPEPWSLGLTIKQIWSVFGNDSRESVSQMVLQPFINYNLPDNWYLVSDMDMIANWNSEDEQRWTVPVGGGVGKLIKVGEYAINTRVEGYYNPVRPDGGSEWSANFSMQLFFGE